MCSKDKKNPISMKKAVDFTGLCTGIIFLIFNENIAIYFILIIVHRFPA
jgi:hypothetical protein